MTDFKELIKLLTGAVDNFQKIVPGIQNSMLDSLRQELAGLKLKGSAIQISAQNVRKIAAIKSKLQALVLTPEYKSAVKEYLAAFKAVEVVQNKYFKGLEKKFKVPELADALQKQAVLGVLQNLTERGIETNVLSGIENILRKNITTGGSYAEMQRALENNITDNESGDGSLTRYTKQITTDALNQHSAQYTQLIASDLGLEWYRYSGSNIETSRPLCLALTKKKWIHISEFPAILRGDFPEFREFNGKLYKGLPAGMIPDTTPANFQINRGGYNCGHQMRPVREDQVPEDVKLALTGGAPKEAKPIPVEPGKAPKPAAPADLSSDDHTVLDANSRFKLYVDQFSRMKSHPELSAYEKAATYGYTGSDYYDLNRYLREEYKPTNPKYMDAYIKALNLALDKMKTVYPGPVFRGARLTQDHIDEYIAAYNKGSVVTHPAFTSTSKDPGGAFGGNVRFTIVSRTGKEVDKLSQHDHEQEVLFKAGTQFRVVSVNSGNSVTHITLEEV